MSKLFHSCHKALDKDPEERHLWIALRNEISRETFWHWHFFFAPLGLCSWSKESRALNRCENHWVISKLWYWGYWTHNSIRGTLWEIGDNGREGPFSYHHVSSLIATSLADRDRDRARAGARVNQICVSYGRVLATLTIFHSDNILLVCQLKIEEQG